MKRVLSWIAGNLGLKSNRTGRTLPGRRRLRLESLEARQLMAIDVYYDDGYRDGDYVHPELEGIHIVGTNGPDEAYVTQKDGQILVKTIDAERAVGVYRIESYKVPAIFFYGQWGNDIFRNESATRTYAWGGDEDDQMFAGEGQAFMWGGAGNDTLEAYAALSAELHGGDDDDTLIGTYTRDVLRGEAGDDAIYGWQGDDEIYGGSGNDRLYGDEGWDTIFGDTGDDRMLGGSGDDTLIGGPNLANGGTDKDTLIGGLGMDFLYGGADSDFLDGNDPAEGYTHDGSWDYLEGQLGADTFVNPYTIQRGRFVREDQVADFAPGKGDRTVNAVGDNFVEIIEGASYTEQQKQMLAGLSQGMSSFGGEMLNDTFDDEAIAEAIDLQSAHDLALLKLLAEVIPSVLDETGSEFSGESLDWIEEPAAVVDELEPVEIGPVELLEEPASDEEPAETTDDLNVLSSPATSWTQTFTNNFFARFW